MSTHFGRRLQLGFGIPILLLLVLSVVSYRSIVVSRAGTGLVRQTHQIIERLFDLQSAMQDIEVGYRGFVLVGDDRFLASYGEGIAAAPVALAAIATLTVDNPEQQGRISALTQFVRREIEFADETVRLRYDAGLQAASERVGGGETLRLMEDVRSLIRDMYVAAKSIECDLIEQATSCAHAHSCIAARSTRMLPTGRRPRATSFKQSVSRPGSQRLRTND